MPPAQIQLQRTANDWVERLRSYRILLDGSPAGSIRRGQTVTLDTEAGRHTVQLAIDWGRSAPVEIELAPGEMRAMRCWPNAKPLTALYWITVGRRRYLGLE